MTGVRYHEDTGWEGKCDACAQYWPLDNEFWYPRQGVRRCRACINEAQSRPARFARKIAPEMLERARAIRLADQRRRKREWARRRRAQGLAA